MDPRIRPPSPAFALLLALALVAVANPLWAQPPEMEELSAPGANVDKPRIAVHSNGDLTVLWHETSGNTERLLARQRVRGQWRPTRLVAQAASLSDPDLAIDAIDMHG